MNKIMKVGAKIEHDRILNAFWQSAAEAVVYRQEELLFDKRFLAAEQAILSYNLLINIPNIYKTAIFSVNAAKWSKAIDTKINELQWL